MLQTADSPEAAKPHQYILSVFRVTEHSVKNPPHFTHTHTHTHTHVYRVDVCMYGFCNVWVFW
jgi:hypothetical protein